MGRCPHLKPQRPAKEQPQLTGARVRLAVADAEDCQQVLPSTGDPTHPCRGSSPTLSAHFCPPSTSPPCHSKEGTHQPQERHRGEEKGLSWALLPARGGTCPPRARTQTFLPMGTAGSDVSLELEPAFPGASCQPHGHCHGATGQRCSSLQSLSLAQVFAKDTSLTRISESWARAWLARFFDTSEYSWAQP